MKYVVRYEDNFDGGSIAVIYRDGKPVEYDTIEDFINAQAEEIASLQEAAAEKDSVIGAQSEEVADLRGFIRSIFPMENPSDVRYANVYIQELISKWESAAQAQSAEGE